LEFFLRVAQPFLAAWDLDDVVFFAVVRFAIVFLVVFLVAFFVVAILKKKTTLYLIMV
jgi:hypothetical protein